MAKQLISPVASLRILCLLLLLFPAFIAGDVGIPGGVEHRDVSDPSVQNAAAFAVQAYNKASSDSFYYKVLRILNAKSQVVEGIKYYLTVELVNTQCEKKSGAELNEAELEQCAVAPHAEQQKQICKFQIWSRPWLKDTQLVYMNCAAASS